MTKIQRVIPNQNIGNLTKKWSQKPVIGLVPSFDDGSGTVMFDDQTERVYVRTEYTQVLVSVGAIPLILSPDMPPEMVTELCDGVVISGGFDIAPTFYGQEQLTDQPLEPIKRYMWEEVLIDACDRSGVPILGICYGLQRLNLFYGGSLLQDIDTIIPENVGHMNTIHEISFSEDFLGMSKGVQKRINSRHHQAIDELAQGWRVCAEASDGVIEAARGGRHFGMQWHPESDETGVHMYRAFVEYCQGKQD